MTTKQIKAFKAITTKQERAKFLLNLGITASLAIVRTEEDINKAECKWVPAAGNARLPGSFDSQREAMHNAIDFLLDQMEEEKQPKAYPAGVKPSIADHWDLEKDMDETCDPEQEFAMWKEGVLERPGDWRGDEFLLEDFAKYLRQLREQAER